MGKVLLALITLIILISGAYLLLVNKSDKTIVPNVEEKVTEEEKEINITANFSIITNGTTRVFTDPKYHNLSEDVYITADSPNTVQVRAKGITWNDFFATLPMSLTKDCLITGTKQTFCTGENGVLRFFINDTENPNSLETMIKQGDKLLVTFSEN